MNIKTAAAAAAAAKNSTFRLRVGVEVHARLKASRKLFSLGVVETSNFATCPNDELDFLDLGLPGSLPVLNVECVELAASTGLALGGRINLNSFFERKHYFYRDSPLGYQITQQLCPIVSDARLSTIVSKRPQAERDSMRRKGLEMTEEDFYTKVVNIPRIQLEMDTGKSLGDENGCVLLDYNRAGVGLLEIVTEPTLESVEETIAFLTTLRKALVKLETCDGEMESGGFRVDVNVSVHDESYDSHRVEIKNLNSFKSVANAVRLEQTRLESLMRLNGKNAIDDSRRAETRGYDAASNTTHALRTKDSFSDYRFMPEPDLPGTISDMLFSGDENAEKEFLLKVEFQTKETPEQTIERCLKDYPKLSIEELRAAVDSLEVFEMWNSFNHENKGHEKVLVFVTNDVVPIWTESKRPEVAEKVFELWHVKHEITRTIAQKLLLNCDTKEQVEKTFASAGKISDPVALTKLAKRVVSEKPVLVGAYSSASESKKLKIFEAIVGAGMGMSKGRADPEVLRKALLGELHA